MAPPIVIFGSVFSSVFALSRLHAVRSTPANMHAITADIRCFILPPQLSFLSSIIELSLSLLYL